VTCEERAEMEVVDISSPLRLRQGEVEKEDGFDSCVEWDPESPICTQTKDEELEAHHETSHSARYSTPTIHPITDQYINHRSSSASEAGRWLSVL
jgi:hypothetical protein